MKNIEMIPLRLLQVDTTQPRKTFEEEALQLLKDSIQEYGILIPLFVRKIATRAGDVYIVLDGERRYRTASALGLKEVPCIIEDISDNFQILERQLMLDCLKEKLSSSERDSAIHQYWKMLKTLPKEKLEKMKPKKIRSDVEDWTIYYISKHVGISSYVVRMAVNKFDFIERNINFHEKILEMIEGNEENKALMEKRYNSVLEETARKAEFRDNEDARKAVIENFVKNTGEGISSHELRDNIKDMVEEGDLSKKTINRKTENPKTPKGIIDNYIEKLAKITSDLIDTLKDNEMSVEKLTKLYEQLLTKSLLETLCQLTGKEYDLKEKK